MTRKKKEEKKKLFLRITIKYSLPLKINFDIISNLNSLFNYISNFITQILTNGINRSRSLQRLHSPVTFPSTYMAPPSNYRWRLQKSYSHSPLLASNTTFYSSKWFSLFTLTTKPLRESIGFFSLLRVHNIPFFFPCTFLININFERVGHIEFIVPPLDSFVKNWRGRRGRSRNDLELIRLAGMLRCG